MLGGRTGGQMAAVRSLPWVATVLPETIVLSTIKRTDRNQGRGFIVRVYNPTGASIAGARVCVHCFLCVRASSR